MPTSDTDAGHLTPERKQILIASGVLFFISLGVMIPFWGLFLGWVFTFTGGVVGGGLIGGLRRRGGADGLMYGAIVGCVGGLPASILGAGLGTFLRYERETWIEFTIDSFLFWAILGFVSGMVFKLVGATVAGGLVGGLLDERD